MLTLSKGHYFGEFIRREENDFFDLSLTSYGINDTIKKHYHENDYLSILIDGSYTEASGRENNVIGPGDILFRPSGYEHSNIFDSDYSSCFNIEFKADWNQFFDKKLRLPANFSFLKTLHFPTLFKLLINFKCNYNKDLALEFVYDWILDINKTPHFQGYHPWLVTVDKILENELDIFHSLRSIADRVCVHPVYMARVFKEKKGITIGEYQMKAKLDNTVSMLLNSSLPIGAISFENGFYDDAHFIRSFKLHYGISPARFRQRMKS